MNTFLEGLNGAVSLIISFDRETYSIIGLSLFVSVTATVFASFFGIFLGIILGVKDFLFKKLVIRVVYTFMSIPPVIVGLFVYIFLRRKGPLGFLQLMYTPTAMIIAQFLLVLPIVTGYVYNITQTKGAEVFKVGKTLGAGRVQSYVLLIKELRNELMVSVVTGYGRAISEVGAVMMVGGNIEGFTRVMTTSIVMLQSMGRFEMAIAFGIVLLAISFCIQSILHVFQGGY